MPTVGRYSPGVAGLTFGRCPFRLRHPEAAFRSLSAFDRRLSFEKGEDEWKPGSR